MSPWPSLAALVALATFFTGCAAMKIQTIGSPIGSSLRTPTYVATLISTLEPYTPSLHRDAGKDRYRIGLLLNFHSGERRFVPVAEGFSGGFTARLLGFDGELLWLLAGETFAYDARAGRLLEERQPPRSLPQRGLSFTEDVTRCYSSGLLVSPDEWFGIHSEPEIERHLKPGARVMGGAPPLDGLNRDRRLYRAPLDRSGPIPKFGPLTPVTPATYIGGALLRLQDAPGPLRLSAPDGFLLTYWTSRLPTGHAMVARIDLAGNALWTADTGLRQFEQVLPDAEAFAFIGRRHEENKVGEPLLVYLNHQNGALTTRSLLVK